ncbi:unnamed protein product [Ectocarpus sp. 6 AP-2014]
MGIAMRTAVEKAAAMNIEAFLAAQLWLRPLPAQAWPTWSTTPTEAAARRGARDPDRKTTTAGTGVNVRDGGLEGSGTVVLLPRARCCFVLENRPSTTAAAGVRKRSGSSSSSNNNGRNAGKRSRTLYLSTTRRGASDDKSHGDGGSRTTNKGVPDDDGNSAPGAREAQSRGGRPPGQSRGDPGISYYGFQQDNSGAVRPPRGKGQGEGRPITTTSCTEGALACEFDFGLAIARPTPPPGGHAKPRGGAGGGHLPPAEEEGGGGGGALLLRIEGKVYEAKHTLIRSIAYPRGGGSSGNGGAGAGNPRGPSDESGAAKPATNPVDGGNADSNRGRVDERGRGPMAAVRASPPPTPPPTASAVAGGKRKAGGSSGDGAAGTGRGGSAGASDGLQEGAGRRGQVDSAEGTFGAAAGGGDGRGDLLGAAAAAAAAAETTQQKRRSGAGTPFCGLFFPGILLKFWNSERTPARDGGDARAEAVTKMQGVVSEMLARLSPNRSCHRATSAGGTLPQELECLARSAVAEGEDTGFRRQYEAWDEFVYGSHVLFQEGYRRPQQCALDLRQQGGHDGGGTATGGPIVRTPCSDWEGTDAPALCESIGNGSARLGGGSLSDVGRTRSLTVLAECFRQDTRYGSEGKTKIKRTPKAGQASLPCPVRLVAQRRLDATSTSAGRELEDALDRAFPLDLSQGTDSTSRETTVSELKDSLRRVQAARKSVLALAILPASTILDESSGDTFA